MRNNIIILSNKVIEYSFYLLFFLTPLILTTVNYELFEFNKMLLVYSLTVIITISWLLKSLVQKRFEFKKTPFNYPLLAFLFSQIVSTVFSLDHYTSLWGYYSRFHGGLVSTFCYLLLFFAFINNFPKELIKTRLFISIGSSALLLSLWAILEHLGIDKDWWVQDVQNRVFSTLGQPNWLAAYINVLLTVTLGIGLYYYLSLGKNTKEIQNSKFKIQNDNVKFKSNICLSLFIILYSIFYSVLLFTKSRSGFIGFALSFNLFWILILLNYKKRIYAFCSAFFTLPIAYSFFGKTPWVIAFFWGGYLFFFITSFMGFKKIFGKIFLAITFLFIFLTLFIKTPFTNLNFQDLSPIKSKNVQGINAPSNTILETGITESGDIRKIVWKGAWDIFTHHPFIGAGVESFAYAYYQYRPAAHNLTSEWDFLYNKAHNEYLNILATSGLLGIISYLSFIIVFIVYILKSIKKTIHSSLLTINLALFCGFVSILITNFFGFSVVMIGLFFFLIPAISFVLSENPASDKLSNLKNNTSAFSSKEKFNLIIIVVLGIILEIKVATIWLADYYFATGNNQSRSEQPLLSFQSYQKAIFLNPSVPLYHSETGYLTSLISASYWKQNDKKNAIDFLNLALAEDTKALVLAPNNVNFWKNSVKTHYELSGINEKYLLEAISALTIAQKLSPTDPKIPYNLAIFYGRLAQNDKAIKLLQQTIQLKPNYKDAHFAIALFYEETDKLEMAKKHLTEILTKIYPNDKEIRKKLEEINKK